MNVFILNSGRCGSTTFIEACKHITNFTAGHETRAKMIGEARLDYPDNHIEADNRLSWMLGRLDLKYGDNAYYVHLTRALEPTTESFARREAFGIMKAYREGILMGGADEASAKDLALDYLATIDANIALFLKDKSRVMTFRLENGADDFRSFFSWIGAEGSLETALAEWGVRHNASVDGGN